MLEVERGHAGDTGEEHRGDHQYEDCGHWISFRCSSDFNLENPDERRMRTLLKVRKSSLAQGEQDNAPGHQGGGKNHGAGAAFFKEKDAQYGRPDDASFAEGGNNPERGAGLTPEHDGVGDHRNNTTERAERQGLRCGDPRPTSSNGDRDQPHE